MSLDKRAELINHIASIVSSLTELNTLTKDEKQKIADKIAKPKGVPISAFKANLSGLEIVIKYLKEVENMSIKKIAHLLNRKSSTAYNTYNNSKIKFRDPLDVSDVSVLIPFTIFSNRNFSVQESIVAYLIDKDLTLVQIASMLNRKYSTIKTTYHRFRLKNEEKK